MDVCMDVGEYVYMDVGEYVYMDMHGRMETQALGSHRGVEEERPCMGEERPCMGG